MHEMSSIMRRYGIKERRLTGFGDPPEHETDEDQVFLADDETLLAAMVESMENLEEVFDMNGTKPWQHFKRMTRADFIGVAHRVLASSLLTAYGPAADNCQMCLKRTHAGRDPDELVDGYTFQQRFDDIIDLMGVSFPSSLRKRTCINFFPALQRFCRAYASAIYP